MTLRLRLPFLLSSNCPKHKLVGTSILEEEGAVSFEGLNRPGIFMRTLSLFNTIKDRIEGYFQKTSYPVTSFISIKS
jgi:hypothetical protein